MIAKQHIFNEIAQVAKALGNGQRLAILEQLAQAPLPVDSLAKAFNLPIANVSQHLQNLRRAGLVNASRSGKQMIYQLTDDRTILAINTLRHLAEDNIAGVEELAKGLFTDSKANHQLDTVSKEELLDGIHNKSITLLDVRPTHEFLNGHLPGAINAPVDQLELALDKLPKETDIIAYCRGPYCTFSHEAVKQLTSLGYSVKRYDEGLPQWRAYGLPIDTN